MKTPDEIKKGLECCFTRGKGCDYCPYVDEDGVICTNGELGKDALAYIQQLEGELEDEKKRNQYFVDGLLTLADEAINFNDEVKKIKRERDFLLHYLDNWSSTL